MEKKYPDRMGSVARGHVGILLRRVRSRLEALVAMDSFLGEVRRGGARVRAEGKPQGQQSSMDKWAAGASLEAECRQRWDFMLSGPAPSDTKDL